MRERVESGQSVRAYCENAGIHENVYYYWQRKLREAACDGLSTMQRGATSLSAAGFTEVVLPERPTPLISGAVVQNQISIEVSGVRLTASSEYPADKLAGLVRELRRPC